MIRNNELIVFFFLIKLMNLKYVFFLLTLHGYSYHIDQNIFKMSNLISE